MNIDLEIFSLLLIEVEIPKLFHLPFFLLKKKNNNLYFEVVKLTKKNVYPNYWFWNWLNNRIWEISNGYSREALGRYVSETSALIFCTNIQYSFYPLITIVRNAGVPGVPE